MANMASVSGNEGDSYTLQTLDSFLPFLNESLVVDACAIMWPPIGFFYSPANIAPPSTWATTWFVITTATPNSSAILYKVLKNLAKCIYLADSSPLPL